MSDTKLIFWNKNNEKIEISYKNASSQFFGIMPGCECKLKFLVKCVFLSIFSRWIRIWQKKYRFLNKLLTKTIIFDNFSIKKIERNYLNFETIFREKLSQLSQTNGRFGISDPEIGGQGGFDPWAVGVGKSRRTVLLMLILYWIFSFCSGMIRHKTSQNQSNRFDNSFKVCGLREISQNNDKADEKHRCWNRIFSHIIQMFHSCWLFNIIY